MVLFSTFSFGQQTINGTITHGGLQRSYILYVPANYTGNTAVPLLFNFHGYGSNAQQQLFYGNFTAIADTAGFIIVHPQGTVDGAGSTHFNVGWGTSSVDDVGFTSALIDSLAASYNINEERVYSTGMSNGGFMSFKLACDLSYRIAAIGSVTGSMTLGSMPSCNATHPTPVVQIHGTSDGTVAYNGSVFSESISAVLNYWGNFNNTGTPSTDALPNISTTDGSTVEKISRVGGDNCSEVVHYKVTGGSHTWPGAPIDIGGTNYDINASKIVWEFVSRYDINGYIGNCTAGTNDLSSAPELTIYPNPASTEIRLDGLNTEVDFELVSVLGESVKSGKLSSTSNVIAVSELERGIYFLKVEGGVFEVVVR